MPSSWAAETWLSSASGPHAALDRARSEPDRDQLPMRDDPVLICRDSRNLLVELFSSHHRAPRVVDIEAG
jgi:hypothetical protein